MAVFCAAAEILPSITVLSPVRPGLEQHSRCQTLIILLGDFLQMFTNVTKVLSAVDVDLLYVDVTLLLSRGIMLFFLADSSPMWDL